MREFCTNMNLEIDKKIYFIVSVHVADKLNRVKWFTNLFDATTWVDGLEWATGSDVEMTVTIDKRAIPVRIGNTRQMSLFSVFNEGESSK